MKYFEQNGTVTEVIIQIIFLQFYVWKEICCQREGLFKWFIRKSGPFAKLFLQQECLFNLLRFSGSPFKELCDIIQWHGLLSFGISAHRQPSIDLK